MTKATVHPGWTDSSKSITPRGRYCTLITRRHATVLRVGRPVGIRDQLDTRQLMAAPGGNGRRG